MNVLLTGTGGADGIPGFFAESNVSRLARANGGKDVRLRSGAVVDEILKIDFGPDTFGQCCRLNLDPCRWKYILYTHSHDDHFAPKELQYAFPPFVQADSKAPEIYGNKTILDGIRNAFPQAAKLKMVLLESFKTTMAGDYTITPIRAYHKLDEDSLNLIIEKNGKKFLYGADTGIYQQETWDFLKDWTIDAAVLECTDGFNPADYWGHLSCAELISVVDRLRSMGTFTKETLVCTTHHSHTGLGSHSELEACLNPHGIEVGFDGKLLEF